MRSPQTRQAAEQRVGKGRAVTALSLVGFDEQLTPAMKSVFGGVFVCDGLTFVFVFVFVFF